MNGPTRQMIVFLLLAVAVAGLPACAEKKDKAASGTTGQNEVVGYVYGDPITLAEIEERASGGLKKLQQDRYDLLRNTLEAVVAEKMLAKEAEERGITAEELFANEVNNKVPEPTREEVAAFYEANKERAGGRSLEEVGNTIVRMLKQSATGERRDQFFAELKEKAGYQTLLEPPRSEVSIPAGAEVKGAKDAPVTIVEYADYQCPYCKRAYPGLTRLLMEYGDKIRYVFLDFPLDFHPQAIPASVAARCAGEQGKFWEYHDNLMAMMGDLGPEDLKSRAQQVGLDADEFNTCVNSGTKEPEIQSAMAQGKELGVTGTPSYFVNGRMMVGAVPYEQLKAVVDEELAMIQGKKAKSDG